MADNRFLVHVTTDRHWLHECGCEEANGTVIASTHCKEEGSKDA